MRVFSLQRSIDGRIKLRRISKCLKTHYVSVIINWENMDFIFANVFSYNMSSHYLLPKADDVLEELRYKRESEESSEV